MTPDGCYFYHTVDLPEPYGLQVGEWDLRGNVAAYLGQARVAGCTVFEIGAANGGVTFWMEEHGATVVPLDLSPDHAWDIVPGSGEFSTERAAHIGRINRAFNAVRDSRGYQSQLIHGSAYEADRIWQETGRAAPDIVTFGSVLLHMRDPLGALMAGARTGTRTIIVTEIFPHSMSVEEATRMPVAVFAAAVYGASETWWHVSPASYCWFLRRMGFSEQTVTCHEQLYRNQPVPMWTVVATR